MACLSFFLCVWIRNRTLMAEFLFTFPFILAGILHMVYEPLPREISSSGLELVTYRPVSNSAPTAMATALLRRMSDFPDAEDKLQCLLMALVLLSHVHHEADSLLPALEQAARDVDLARLLRDIQHVEQGWAWSTCGAEAYALTMLCAAIRSTKNVEE